MLAQLFHPTGGGVRREACLSGTTGCSAARRPSPAGHGFLGMLVASIHFPLFAFPVDEGAVTGHRIGAVPGVTHAVVDEPEALAGLDAEGFGVVSH